MDIEFSNIMELKKRLTPALKIRVKELKNNNIDFDIEELWKYFSNIWKNSHDLTLAKMVDDILNTKIDVL